MAGSSVWSIFIMCEQKNHKSADIEALADGNLKDGEAKSIEAYIRKDIKALDQMFSLARLNTALRKAKNAAYSDDKLSDKLSKLKKK